MNNKLLTKTLIVAMVTTQALQWLSSASYLSWFNVDRSESTWLLGWIRSTFVYEIKELAYTYDLDQDDENDVDVYDDTPSARSYGYNWFLFKRSSTVTTNEDTQDEEDKKAAKETARLPRRPFPAVPTRAARPNDVDVYDDTYVRGDDYTNFLRLRPMKRNDNEASVVKEPTTTTTTKSVVATTSDTTLVQSPVTTNDNDVSDETSDLDDLEFIPLVTLPGFDFDPIIGVTHYATSNLWSTWGQVVIIRSDLYTWTAMIIQRTFSSDEFTEEYPEYDASEIEQWIIETFIDTTAIIYTNKVGQNMAIYKIWSMSAIILLSKNTEDNWTMSMIMIDDENEQFKSDITKLIDSLSTSGEDIVPSSDDLENQL